MADYSATIKGTLDALMEGKKYTAVKDILNTMNPSDIAAVLDETDEALLPAMFRLLQKDLAADSFVELNQDTQEFLIRGFSDKELYTVVNELYVDEAVDIVEEMPANVVGRILQQANPEMRKKINEILKYPEDSAGSEMTTEYVALRTSMTVGEAIAFIRQTGLDKETIYTCYVTENRKLVGIVTIKDLLLEKDDSTLITKLMDENVISVSTHTDQEEVAQMFSKYNFMAMPVVDSEGRMVGIITVDDALEVMEEEATEDMSLMAGVNPTDNEYLRSNPFELYIHRIPWLMILMLMATLTSLIINRFESALAANIILTAFIPMLMGTGGNSGSQTSATIIRSLSLGELEFKDLPKVILKEFLTALLCGLTLAAGCFAKLMLLDRYIMHNSALTLEIALIVSLAMLATVVIAKFFSAVLPIITDRLGWDPAIMSGPFITTCVDAISLIVYFAISSTVLF